MKERRKKEISELLAKALEILNYLAVKYQNKDADEACRLVSGALAKLAEK